MSNLEQTLSIIKPDAVERNLEKKIEDHFIKNDFKIINKKKVKIKKTDSVKTLSAKVLSQEHKLYPAAINKIFN